MVDTFLSYSRADARTVGTLSVMLGRRGFSCWYDKNLELGKEYEPAIEAALKEAKSVIVCWSPTAVRSAWVRAEASEGLSRGILIPILLHACEIPLLFRPLHTASLEGWDGDLDHPAFIALCGKAQELIIAAPAIPTSEDSRSEIRMLEVEPPRSASERGAPPITFTINKTFGRLDLSPAMDGLRLRYQPVVNGAIKADDPGAIDVKLPLQAIGGLWATAKAFLYGVESLDENVILRGPGGDVLVQFHRDKPEGEPPRLKGNELCWLRIVSGREEHERRRIRLGPRDLLSIELACLASLTIAAGGRFYESC